MNRTEAENYIYQSYLRAEQLEKDQAIKMIRNPGLTKDLISRMSGRPAVVVTGSKGKGSTALMISRILRPFYRTGLMTSPHLLDFCERFQVDGEQISDQDLARIMTDLKGSFDGIEKQICLDCEERGRNNYISPMGIQAALALRYFEEQATDINILECGKGAKYDDVNNVLHEYAVINSIFPEHRRELGDTIEEIAADKAHVITGDQKGVYIGPQEKGVLTILLNRARSLGVTAKVYGRDFHAENISCDRKGTRLDLVLGEKIIRDIRIPLIGDHQARNCALAMAVCQDILADLGQDIPANQGETGLLSGEAVRQELSHLKRPGRMEILSDNPFILVDACIHQASAREVLRTLNMLNISESPVIIGIPDDKDYLGVARVMKEVASPLILTRSGNPHYIFTNRQADILKSQGIPALWAESLEEALDLAGTFARERKKGAAKGSPEKSLIILGTTSLISEVEKLRSYLS